MIEIREGTIEEAALITDMIKQMVDEMAQHGGYPVNNSLETWSSVEAIVRANITREDTIYLIASQVLPVPATVGMAAASIEVLDNIFLAQKRMHISAVYTIPSMRRRGIARELIEKAFEWGRRMNAIEAELNVLVANPARRFYKDLGFEPHQISMVKKLCSDLHKDG